MRQNVHNLAAIQSQCRAWKVEPRFIFFNMISEGRVLAKLKQSRSV